MKLGLMAIVMVAVCAIPGGASAVPPAQKCAAAKISAAAKKARKKLACAAAAIRAGTLVKATCLQTAEKNFAAAFQAAEDKGGCQHSGDAAAIESSVDSFVDSMVAAQDGSLKFIFASSALYNGNLGGLSGGDAKCAALASAAGLPGTYKAWLSDSFTTAYDRLSPAAVPYYLVTGSKVADDWGDLIDGDLDHAINRTESGVKLGPNDTEVWTGLASHNCADWTSASSDFDGFIGLLTRTSAQWAFVYSQACDRTNLHLYCLQQ